MIKIVLFIYILFAIFLSSCKKELSCENCIDSNKAPIALAGFDVNIVLPLDSVLLDGSASHDPDGKIIKWWWTKISGPGTFKISDQSNARTLVYDLLTGTYSFELNVKDDKGLAAKDTINISVQAGAQTNMPPIANAGPDQIINLPTASVSIDGSNSTDPDNNITLYSWTKISGPSSFTISNSNAIQTQVTNLVEGIYQFELKVTDIGGLFSRDTVKVTVNVQPTTSLTCDNSNRLLVNARLKPLFAFTPPSLRHEHVIMVGNKIVFAGGRCNGCINDTLYTRVDIYDLTSKSWSTARLSVARYLISTITVDNKIFFAGGEIGDGTTPVSAVDIYDADANTWTVANLSTAGHSIVAAAVGNKVLFAGGDGGFNNTPGLNRSKQVDIYNLDTKAWSTASLSESKFNGHTAVTYNSKVYIAGGVTVRNNPSTGFGESYASAQVDVYDIANNTWSVTTMREGKYNFAAITDEGKIYWAGGITGSGNSIQASCLVEKRDERSGTSSEIHLFEQSELGPPIVINHKIVFFKLSANGVYKFDIYDSITNSWSIGILQANLTGDYFYFISGNSIYFAGGIINGEANQLWQMEF